jgi:hypothetical protein
VGLGCPAPASVEWTNPAVMGPAATAIRLLGIHGDAGMGSRFQPVGLLAIRGLDPAVTANHNTVALLTSPARRPSSVDPQLIAAAVASTVRTGRRVGPTTGQHQHAQPGSDQRLLLQQ